MRWIGAGLWVLGCSCLGSIHDDGPLGGAEPPPANSQVIGVGYDDAVRMGAAWAQHQTYQAELAGVRQMGGDGWLLRYGVLRNGEHRQVEVYVDTVSGRVSQVPQTEVRVTGQPKG
jgi:hypothetical protein